MHPVNVPTVPHSIRSARSVDRGTTVALPLTVADLVRWVATASPGDTITYHRGFLSLDRVAGSRLGNEAGQELDRLAGTLMAMAERGDVHLVQRRNTSDDYSYIAVAAREGDGRGPGPQVREAAS